MTHDNIREHTHGLSLEDTRKPIHYSENRWIKESFPLKSTLQANPAFCEKTSYFMQEF